MQPHGVLETIIYADDLTGIKQFYTDVLGLEVLDEDPPHHIFFRCRQSLFLVFNPDRSSGHNMEVAGVEIPRHGAHGPCHMAFRMKENELEEWRQKLTEKEIEIEAEIDWPQGGKSLYFRDPANNSIELATAKLWKILED
ncbi:fosfomycin resistance protein FosB [Polystyrenella longa]|uniref:Fosfomycin resistance protein FosB n=1 Tax=Polystyrenella longa TaxID=2528007 RepID=A0A518CU55_9PLAN|nr:VOC family protein [Polystyrenella longa]QDU82763.1 fosfomycin resistance protein FosB [Polystyrenella longa]